MKTSTKKRKQIRMGAMITITLVLVIAGLFLFLRPDQEELNAFQDQISEEAGEITKNLQAQIQEATEESRTQAQDPEADRAHLGETSADSNAQTKLTTNQKKQLEAVLAQKYRVILEDLKNQATGMLVAVLNQAKQEYSDLLASGNKNPETLGTLATEYMTKVDMMEDQMDASFDTLIQDMEAQFKAQGIDGAAIISQYQSEYNQVKETNRQAFMDKAWEFLD